MTYCHHAARAIIENDRVRLSDEDLEALLADNPKVGTFVRDNFKGIFFSKGVHRLARDLEISLSVANGEVVPEPEGETLELLLLLGQIHACQVMRATTANAFSFSSGDKRVDKTKQPEHWARLEEDLKSSTRSGWATSSREPPHRRRITSSRREVLRR